MRKYLVLLLVLLLCAFGAAAEGLQTEGEFDYFVQDLAWMETKSVLIMGYHLPEGQDYVFIPMELGGYPVTAADLQGLPESVKTVYAYQSNAGILPPVGRELTEIIYVDYALVQANADYKAKLPNMAEGDIALAEAASIRRGEDNMPVQSALPAAEVANLDFPQELGGHRVHHNILTNVSTEPGMTFASRPGGRAEIVDIRLAEGQNYVFIPVYWNNLAVYVEGETIPEQVEVVYTSWGGGIIPPAEGRTLTEVFYVSDEEAKQYSEVKDIQPGDIALMVVRRFRTENGELVEEGSSYAADHRIEPGIPYLKAEDFPKELDGHRVNATALGTGAFAELMGECWYRDQFGNPAIVDAQLPEGAREVVVPTDFVENQFVWLYLDNLGEDIRTFYIPYGAYGQLTMQESLSRGNAYCKMIYADYALVQADPALRLAFPEMGEDDYALVECQVEMPYDHQENIWSVRVGFDPATLPTELRGHKLLLHPTLNEGVELFDYQRLCRAEMDAEMADWFGLPPEEEVLNADNSAGESDGTVYTYGELLYTRNDAQQSATIMGYELAEGQTELFIPTAIEGYTVVDFEYELVPLQIEKLWVNQNTGKMIWNFGDKPKNHERLAYNYTQTEEGSIALDSIVLESWDGEGNMDSQRQFIDTAAVPETIAGNKVTIAIGNGQTVAGDGLITDGWEYLPAFHSDGRKYADILACPDKEWGDTMVIPMSINEFTPRLIALEAIPESVHTVIFPGDGTTWHIINNTPSNRVLRQITYTDWEGADQSEALDRPAEMQQDDLMWTRVLTHDFATGESLDCMPYNIVSEEELPAEINGQRVINFAGAIAVSYTSGDWEYMLDDYLHTNLEAYILAYNGEDEPEYLVIPEKLDGNKVGAIYVEAIPESVKTIFVKGYNTSIFADNSNHSRQLLMVTYRDTTKSMMTLQDVFMTKVEDGLMSQSVGVMNAADLPKEIDGKKVLVPQSMYFLYTSDEWTYCVVPYGIGGKTIAWIVDSTLEEGITELTLPKELDGYKVNYIDTAAIPQSVKTVTMPQNTFVREENGGPRPDLKIVQEKN